MINIFVLSAIVLISNSGWVGGEKIHPRLTPIVFNSYQECKLERRKARALYRENKEYLKENYGVLRISLKCTKKTK